MLVENQLVEVKWHPSNKQRLESLGYKYTGIGTSVYVKIEDVSNGSKSFVEVICDYCGRHYNKRYKDYFAQRQNGKDCCCNCTHKKICETDKIRYGGNSPSCSVEIVKKQRQSLMDNYGVTTPSKSEEVKTKMKNTCLSRYGVEIASKSEEVKAKTALTCQERYGGNSSQCDLEVRMKTMKTKMQNGNIPTSKQELEMVNKLKNIYGEENCTQQYILDKIAFDCLLKVNNINIDVEYDGIYWHQDKHKDIKRDYYTISKGFKVLRFRGKNKSPTIEQIKQGVNYLVNSEHHHLIIEI